VVELIFGTWRGFDLWSLVLNRNFRKLGWHWRRWLGGIYSLQPLPSRWLSLLAMGTPDSPVVHQTTTVHCPVRAMSARPLEFGATWSLEPLSYSSSGQSGATPNMSGVLWLLCSELWRALFTLESAVGARLSLLRWLTGHVRCTPDSLVNYSGAPLGNSREWAIRVLLGLGHGTLSSAPLGSTLSCLALNLFEFPIEFLSWFVLNLMHLR
jgi:hypothetical protein